MDQKNLITLLRILSKNKVTYYKDQHLELKLELDKPESSEKSQSYPNIIHQQESLTTNAAMGIGSMIPKEEPMSDEDFLYYSSGYDPKDNKLVDPGKA